MEANKKIFRLVLFSVVAVLLLGFLPNNAEAYTITGWVWHDRAKVQWNPTVPGGPQCGSMVLPVRYTINNRAAQGAIAADDQDTQAFNAANAWNAATGGIINYFFNPGEINIAWVPDANWNPPNPNIPADTQVIPPVPINIRLNLLHTTRSDLWTVQTPAGDGPIQFDMYTTLVHEFGHDLGLNHRRQVGTIMTAQNTARGVGIVCPASGCWGPAAATPPPAGVPAGSVAWFNPRAALAADDILGAITLYTVPIPIVVAIVPVFNGATGRWVYHYTVHNGADARSDHYISAFRVPTPAGSVITVTPVGWAGAIVGGMVTWTTPLVPGAAGNLIPPGGGPRDFEFENPNPPVMGAPETEWKWPHCDFAGPGSPINGDYEGDVPPENVTLAFDPNNAWIASENKYVPGLAPVGGYSVSIDKPLLLTPDISSAFVILVATVASAIYVKRVKRKKEKQ